MLHKKSYVKHVALYILVIFKSYNWFNMWKIFMSSKSSGMCEMFKIYTTDCIVQLKPVTLNGCMKIFWPAVVNDVWGTVN